MRKVINLELLQQDILLIKGLDGENIAKELDFFLTEDAANAVAEELSESTVAFRQWKTSKGVKNLLFINTNDVAMVSRIVVHAAFDILNYKEVDSEEMVGLLVQYIMQEAIN